MEAYTRLGFSEEEARGLHAIYLKSPSSRYADEEEFVQMVRNISRGITPNLSETELEMLVRKAQED